MKRGRPRTYNINENYFEIIDTSNKAYILGFIFADGSVNNTSLNISLNKKDFEILEFIKKELESEHPIKTFNIKNNIEDYIRYSISNIKICEDLIKNNIIQNKTYNTTTLPYNGKYFNHFLRGLFDGDGSITVSKNAPNDYCISLSNNYCILLEIKEFLIKELNINSYLRLRHKDNYNSGMLEFKGSLQIERFYNYIYNNSLFHLRRKENKFKISLENAIKFKKTNYRNNGTWDKIKELYLLGESQINISIKLNINYGSIRSCVQKMRKENIL